MPMTTDPKAILDYTLARHSAAMLDLPELVCLHRDCRRAHDCRYLIAGDPPSPDCLDLLTPEDRARFDAFLDVVHAMIPHGPAANAGPPRGPRDATGSMRRIAGGLHPVPRRSALDTPLATPIRSDSAKKRTSTPEFLRDSGACQIDEGVLLSPALAFRGELCTDVPFGYF